MTVSTAIPPISSSGPRRITAQEPQKRSHPTCRCRPAPAVKQRPFIWRFTKTAQLRSNGSGEKSGAASASSPAFILQEPAHGHLQERAGGHVVTVENRDELAFRILQRIVDITGLGMFVAGTRDVMYADIFCELAKLFAPAVIRIQILSLSFGQSIPCEA